MTDALTIDSQLAVVSARLHIHLLQPRQSHQGEERLSFPFYKDGEPSSLSALPHACSFSERSSFKGPQRVLTQGRGWRPTLPTPHLGLTSEVPRRQLRGRGCPRPRLGGGGGGRLTGGSQPQEMQRKRKRQPLGLGEGRAGPAPTSSSSPGPHQPLPFHQCPPSQSPPLFPPFIPLLLPWFPGEEQRHKGKINRTEGGLGGAFQS